MEVITSLSNKKVKDWCKLKNKKYRDEEELFLVEGEHLVLEAIKSNLAVELMLEENTVFPIDILKCYATKEVLKKISSLDTPPFLKEFIKKLKNDNYQILGTKVTHGTLVENISLKNKYAFIMGNEGNGVDEELLDLCDDYLYIGMNDLCESLNVGVASSIILYELDKKGNK